MCIIHDFILVHFDKNLFFVLVQFDQANNFLLYQHNYKRIIPPFHCFLILISKIVILHSFSLEILYNIETILGGILWLENIRI